jgi:T-complex protein 1 subunit gamma
MKTYGLYESASVKVQTLKTAIEVCIFIVWHVPLQNTYFTLPQAARMLLRVDDVVQAIRREREDGGGGGGPGPDDQPDQQ